MGKTMRVRRHVLFVACALCLPFSTSAQGIGPPPGTEVLLYLFLAMAAVFVLVASTVLFYVGKKALFKERNASRLEKLALLAASIFTSCVAGVVLMAVLGLR